MSFVKNKVILERRELKFVGVKNQSLAVTFLVGIFESVRPA
jgi:hypothetical protein